MSSEWAVHKVWAFVSVANFAHLSLNLSAFLDPTLAPYFKKVPVANSSDFYSVLMQTFST